MKEGNSVPSYLLLTAKIVTDETFSRHEGFNLATFDKRKSPPPDLPTLRVPKQMTYSTFKSRVAQYFNYPESQIRLWVLINRQNKTVRPEVQIPENEPLSSLLSSSHADYFLRCPLAVELIRNNNIRQPSDLRLYLDILPDPSKVSFSPRLPEIS